MKTLDANTREFIRTFVKEIGNSNAAVFAGAGLSRPAGFVDWKGLLKEIADDLELDIDRETDLISIAQYHVNKFGNRSKLCRILIEEFTKDVGITENHNILASLPIQTFWTTNYDKLIENSLSHYEKRYSVKRTQKDFPNSVSNCDAVLYKMHGDIDLPQDAVLTKDDYERYNLTHEVFIDVLKGDLLTKTFLFIGFSFDDPNLQHILSKIRILMGQEQRTHYCFMKRLTLADFENDTYRYSYALTKFNYKIEDLKRYGINVLLVDSYSEITDILKTVGTQCKRANIFISGSASDYGTWGVDRVGAFCSTLSKRLLNAKKNIVTGFGLGIGSFVISAGLEEIYYNQKDSIDKRLKLRPFPQVSSGGIDIKELWTNYRKEMLENVGISIFVFGNKFDSSHNLINANGMIEEFDLSISSGAVPIPIGVTGFTTKDLWDKVISNFDKYIPDSSLKELYQAIGDGTKTDEEIIDCVIKIVNKLSTV